MAVKLLDLSSLIRDLEICDGFTVSVRYVSRPTLLRLIADGDRLSPEEVAAKWADHCIAGWSGLTVPIAWRLNVPLDESMAAADGWVPYDKETAAAVWLYGNADAFSGKVQGFAFKLLDAVEKEKAAAKNDSGASSALSSTH